MRVILIPHAGRCSVGGAVRAGRALVEELRDLTRDRIKGLPSSPSLIAVRAHYSATTFVSILTDANSS